MLPKLQLNTDVLEFPASPPELWLRWRGSGMCLKAEPTQLYLEEQTLGLRVCLRGMEVLVLKAAEQRWMSCPRQLD